MSDAIKIAELAEALGARFEGDGSLEVAGLCHPADASASDVAFASSPEFVEMLGEGNARAALLADGVDWRALGLEVALFAARPRYALAFATEHFAPEERPALGIHPSAVIEEGAQLGADVRIGAFVFVGTGAQIGAGVSLGPHTSVAARAQLGSDCRLGSGVRVGRDVEIGARVRVHDNAVIGADGFSFVTPEKGAVETAKSGQDATSSVRGGGFERIYSLAAVVIGDDVEIGACTTIDRGTLRSTRIGDRTKIDNQVQIGHNVEIGSDCLICGQAGIAGSTKIGDRVVLAGRVAIADHVTIGSDVLVAAGSGVGRDIPDRSIQMGTPALPRDEAMRVMMATRRLPRVLETVADIKKRLSEIDSDG